MASKIDINVVEFCGINPTNLRDLFASSKSLMFHVAYSNDWFIKKHKTKENHVNRRKRGG